MEQEQLFQKHLLLVSASDGTNLPDYPIGLHTLPFQYETHLMTRHSYAEPVQFLLLSSLDIWTWLFSE